MVGISLINQLIYMEKIAGQVILLGAIGAAAYLHEKSTNEFEESVEREVISHQVEHQKNISEEHSLESHVPNALLQECRSKLQQCLNTIPPTESCQDLGIRPYSFYRMYGDDGVNKGFSLAASTCYNKIAEKVDQCENDEISCLRSGTDIRLQTSVKLDK